MKKAIWFGRHNPTPAQYEDAARLGYVFLVTPQATALGSMTLQDNIDVLACINGLLGHVFDYEADAIFGVFAVPILAQIARTFDDIRQRGEVAPGDVPCFAAWNVQRSQEGDKPTFKHRQWLNIGWLNQDSLRWLR
jgi:hypothetical protein